MPEKLKQNGLKLSEKLRMKIWEALAKTNTTPTHAAALMKTQDVIVSVAEAERQLDAAWDRNTLRLVPARDLDGPGPAPAPPASALRSTCGRRIRSS